MYVYNCKMCSGSINVNGNEEIVKCPYCKTQQTLPKITDEKIANLYERASQLRKNNDFDKAIEVYEKLLTMENEDSEIYWSLILCKYGIEYVEDPQTKKHFPTINRLQYGSIYADEDYKLAIKYASSIQKVILEEQAKEIDRVQREILAISQNEEPFDVFICYKETDKDGRRTHDSVLANDLYHQLTQEGYRVFFAKITLEDKLGTAYEPYIFSALNSSQVMIVLGTRKEYFEAVWVRNEWSRYLSLIKKGEKKILIPAYKDMDPYDLPNEFSHLQAQDMSKLGFMQDLIRAVGKMVKKEQPTEKTFEVATSNSSSTEPLLKRIQMFLEFGEYDNARSYIERVLDIEPENANAYIYAMLIDYNIKKKEDLGTLKESFLNNINYKKAIRFADDELKKELMRYNLMIVETNKQEYYNSIIQKMNAAKTIDSYNEVIKLLKKMKGYKDSEFQIGKCEEEIEKLKLQQIEYDYDLCLIRIKRGRTIYNYREVIDMLTRLNGYKDSNDLIENLKQEIEKIEVEQIEEKYNNYLKKIREAIDNDDYQEAIDGLKNLGEYKDSLSLIKECEDNIKSNTYDSVVSRLQSYHPITIEEYKGMISKLKKLGEYKDSKSLIDKCADNIDKLAIFEDKYREAIEIEENNEKNSQRVSELKKAIRIYKELGNYKDSKERIKTCKRNIAKFRRKKNLLITGILFLLIPPTSFIGLILIIVSRIGKKN